MAGGRARGAGRAAGGGRRARRVDDPRGRHAAGRARRGSPVSRIPGFANAHSHAFQRALRGRTHGGQGSFWTWREQMYAAAARIDPDDYLALARATFAEMALAGITLVGEFHYLHHGPGGAPYIDANAMGGAVIAAAARGRHPHHAARRLLPARRHRQAARRGPAALHRPRRGRLGEARGRAGDERAGCAIGAAIHSVRAVDPDSARIVAAWAAERSLPLHAHLSEQPAENEACFAAYGATPTQLLAEAGALSERFSAVHATHLSDGDVGAARRRGSHVLPMPDDRARPGRRHRPGAPTARGGRALALGSDSHAVIDPLEEARAVELDERLATGVRGQHKPRRRSSARRPRGARRASAGPRAAASRRARSRTSSRSSLDGVRLAGTPARHALESVVFAARRRGRAARDGGG